MKKIRPLIFFLLLLTGNHLFSQDYDLVNFTTSDGAKIAGALFNAGDEQVVLFAHGAIFNKESWYFLARELQKKKLSSLSIDFRGYGNSTGGSTMKKSYDILGAIDFLKTKGYGKISIIGGSMGGAAVLAALKEKTDASVKKAVLLAPAGGPAIESSDVAKLFVVAKGDRLFLRVKSVYENSFGPKRLKVYAGSAHAQHLFKSEHANDLTELIIEFIVN